MTEVGAQSSKMNIFFFVWHAALKYGNCWINTS